MHVPLRKTKARSLHLACLKTPPTARGFAMIGCRLSSHWILTFTSLAESSSSIVTRSTQTDRPQSVRNRCNRIFCWRFFLSRCFLDFSVGVGAFVIRVSHIS